MSSGVHPPNHHHLICAHDAFFFFAVVVFVLGGGVTFRLVPLPPIVKTGHHHSILAMAP